MTPPLHPIACLATVAQQQALTPATLQHALIDPLVVVYRFNPADPDRLLTADDIKAAGIEPHALHALAMANLEALAREHLHYHQDGRLFSAFLPHQLDASLILLDGPWDIAFKSLCKHDLIVTLPAPDLLVFGDSESEEAIQGLMDIAAASWEEASDASRITPTLFTREAGQWVPLPDLFDGPE